MTVAEKARELDTTEGVNFLANGAVDVNKSMGWLAGKGIGRVHDLYGTDPRVANELQRAVVRASRFGIGAILGEECTHGNQKDGHTMSDNLIFSYYVEGCMQGCMRAYIIRYFPLSPPQVPGADRLRRLLCPPGAVKRP